MISEGWNVGSVTIRRVLIGDDGEVSVQVRRHGGDPRGAIRAMLDGDGAEPARAAITGALASSMLALPYVPESVCVERALAALGLSPDIVLSLGGESFVVYCLYQGRIRNMVSSSRCAAGSGEFIVQQLGRMGLDLEQGLELARSGRQVFMASRCSVHIKSDATHKLNKGECTPADIARTLVVNLAGKIHQLIASTSWPVESVVVAGGMAQNGLLLDELRRLMPASRIETLPESPYLEGYGAAVAARAGDTQPRSLADCLLTPAADGVPSLAPLGPFAARVERIPPAPQVTPAPGMRVLLGVDAGSTTTKAALLEKDSGRLVAACYLRTHGNPVRAASECLAALQNQTGDCPVEIVQVAVTGSGRDLVSVALGGCLSFNEILAHARAARNAHPGADTIFEIGGQDAKFISLLAGIPVDYAMNDGCSAGTGSFLEEAAASDMATPVEEIGPQALEAVAPASFGERCAAFINSEVRTALQGGMDTRDILAGLVYSIVKNYLARVVGTRHVGDTVLLQGGVALNPAVALAVASLTGRHVIVPATPELMGCIGAALMARDLLGEDKVEEQRSSLDHFQGLRMETGQPFRCGACQNRCEVQRIRVGERSYPFGGLCSRWEMQRRPEGHRHAEGRDLVTWRSDLMFGAFAPPQPAQPRGRAGLPLALTTFELYPFYARLLTELGFEVVLSHPGEGRRNTHAAFCYPGELLHAAVDDLLAQDVDWVFLPQVREFGISEGQAHAYTCSFAEDGASVIREFFSGADTPILTPEIGLSEHLLEMTGRETVALAARFGIAEPEARRALTLALAYQADFERTYRSEGRAALAALEGPRVVLVGRPYVACNAKANLSLPRKIASRGFHVVPADLLPFDPPPGRHNVWHFTQVALSAIDYARTHEGTYVCCLSCFSCNPDAIIYHRVRHELEGRPFCFLEIDSHTADAGIDTRIGAFLDIVEERRQAGAMPAVVAADERYGCIDYNGRKPRIITQAGEVLGFDDPRVMHLLLADLPCITSRLFAALYGRMGWHVAVMPYTDASILQTARRVCSGRECLPFLSMMGKLVLHLEQRRPGEVTVFHLLDQDGPCQIGNWFDAAGLICRRLGAADAFPAWPRINNNYLGGGEAAAVAAAAAAVLGDLCCELRSSLHCLARDPESALALLDAIEDRLVERAAHGLPAIELELRRVRTQLARIPLAKRIEDTPRVLLFSGINRIFVDRPVRDFFEERGILAKTADVGEFLCFYETEPIVRRGFALGRAAPDQQFSAGALLAGLFRNHRSAPRFQAIRARGHVTAIEMLDRRWRRLLAPTGLIFGPEFRYRDVLRAGHARVSLNGWTEAPATVGRYLVSLEEGAFDGFVNVGAFNCAPAANATALVHDVAMRSALPYAVIESDGASITAGQLRQLEAVAARVLERKPVP